jgi:CO/xanthine dehydrogenase FAD-binding subunit
MKPAAFEYHAPSTIDDCTSLLAQLGDDAALLAGGQNLLPLMRFRLAQPASVIAIRGIAGLQSLEEQDGGVGIGAAVTYRQIERSQIVRDLAPGLPRAIELIATPPVRTRGTVCGNLCHADPASELPAVALVLGVRFHLRSRDGTRIVDAADFFLGPYTTARRPDEILERVTFPKRPPNERFAIQEVTRQRGGYPLAGVALALTRGEGQRVLSVAIACFGVHGTPLRLAASEAALRTLGLGEDGVESAVEALSRAVEPHGDAFGSAEYRRSAAGTLLRRALKEASHPGGSAR